MKRMTGRHVTELDLRQMLEDARGWRRGRTSGRWRIETRHAGRRWVVIVEPGSEARLLVVITAYRIE